MKKKYSKGGQILGTFASLIPGYGGVLSPLILGIDKMISQNKQMKHGGFVNDNFKQYNTGSHASGKDLPINQFGIPDIGGQNLVQNKENLIQIKGKPYVMSDVLKNPATGNPFSMDANNLQKKYKNSRFYQDEKTSLDLGLQRLAKLNDKVRKNLKAFGGFTDPPKTGTIFDLGLSVDNNVDPTDNVPPSDNLFWSENNAANIPLTPTPLNKLPQVNSLIQPKQMQVPDVSINTEEISSRQPLSINSIQGSNAIALGLKGLALVRSIKDAVTPAEKEDLIKPDFSNSDRYLKEATIDYTQAKQDAIGASNVLSSLNRGASSSYQQMLGRESARIGQLQNQLGRISEAEANANSQLNMSKAQYEQQKSVDLANRRYQNRVDNQMNEANQRGFTRDLFGDLSRIGTEFNKYGETQRTIQNQKEIANYNNNQMLTYLNSKYPNLKVDPSIIQKFQKGNLTIDDFLSYLPTNVQTDLRNGNQ